MSFPHAETDFNLDKYLIAFLQTNVFYAEISRRVYKYPSRALPTLAVTYHKETDDIALIWNPDFLASLTPDQVMGCLKHEFNHLIFGHLAARRKSPPKMWNVATDLAINSLIVEESGEKSLPDCVLLPGKFPGAPKDRELSSEEKEARPVAQAIASFPKMQSSEWYFSELSKAAEKQKQQRQKQKSNGSGEPGDDDDSDPSSGDIDLDSFDDHTNWDDLPEDIREYVEHKVKSILDKAVKAADQTSNGWGNIPASIRAEIRRSVSNVIPWRQVLRQFIGTLLPGDRTSSIKRINRRYPYVHPGVKRGRIAKLLVAVDQSGSVDDKMLETFYAELTNLAKRVDIDVIPFDYSLSEKDIKRWKKGTRPEFKRERCGGTNFDAPTMLVNNPKNRGRWDALLIVTDGECCAPQSSRVKRGWVLAEGRKLLFSTDEVQVHIDQRPDVKGAWR